MQVVPAIWPKECNDYSIGIELEGSDDLPFEQAQYDALVKVTACLQNYYPKCSSILPDIRTLHRDVKPIRDRILTGVLSCPVTTL